MKSSAVVLRHFFEFGREDDLALLGRQYLCGSIISKAGSHMNPESLFEQHEVSEMLDPLVTSLVVVLLMLSSDSSIISSELCRLIAASTPADTLATRCPMLTPSTLMASRSPRILAIWASRRAMASSALSGTLLARFFSIWKMPKIEALWFSSACFLDVVEYLARLSTGRVFTLSAAEDAVRFRFFMLTALFLNILSSPARDCVLDENKVSIFVGLVCLLRVLALCGS